LLRGKEDKDVRGGIVALGDLLTWTLLSGEVTVRQDVVDGRV
jgi:hypothetical protein